jgi:hypothetical protein
MKIFYIPITNSETINNYENTIVNKLSYNNEKIEDILGINNTGVWGFKDGTHNLREYEKISKGDIIIFRINDDRGYQAIDGFGYVSQKIKDERLSKRFWNDKNYKNIVLINKFIKLNTPFRLCRKKEVVADLNNVPEEIWHKGYNMFRQWDMKEFISEEEFINILLTKTQHKVIYSPNQYPLYTKESSSKYNIQNDLKITKTEKEMIIKGRIKQGRFRELLLHKYNGCCLCGIEDSNFLIASHIKPWSESNSEERLDIENGFIFCVHHDALFDKGYISFDDNGDIIISNHLDEKTKILMNIKETDSLNIELSEKNKYYLEWHRQKLLKD